MKLPIGTLVHFTSRNGIVPQSNGIIKGYNTVCEGMYNITQNGNSQYDWVGIAAYEDEVKIRYDLAAPFTLWQLNILAFEKANDLWIETGNMIFRDGLPKIGNDQIAAYWEYFYDNQY